MNYLLMYDALQDVKLKFQNELVSTIDAINTKLGTTLLQPINSSAWIEGSLNETVTSYNPFVFYLISGLNSEVNGPDVAKVFSVDFNLAVQKSGDFADYKRLVCYWDAFIEASKNVFDTALRGYARPEIEILGPIDIEFFNSSEPSAIIGVRLTFSIA